MNQITVAPPAASVATAVPTAKEDTIAVHAGENALDWSDSGDNNSQDDEYVPPPQGPSLSYERKIRLHKYAENRARSCLGLLADSSNALWKVHECKNDIDVYKPSSDWSESVSAKAVVFANAAFPNVLKTIYDLKTSDKFKLFMRKILGDIFLDAEVLEDLNGTGVYPSANPPRDAREMYKQAAIKWWAIKSGSLASKSSDFYVLEYIGIETSGGDIVACYIFQESLAEVGGMPHIQGNNLERSQFDALICKFERTSSPDYKDDFVTISIAFQRPPPLVSLFRSNPAVEMVTQLARGLRDLLEDPPELQEISVVKTSAWVKDKERRFCVLCNRRFSPIFRRRHHCRTCGEVICWSCSSTIRVPSISFTHNDTGKQVLSRHQPSIRVCSKCVVSHHRSKSGRDLNNQEDFKDWIQRSTEQQQLATAGETGNAQQLRLPSPSHSQDLAGALEAPRDKLEQISVAKEERMPRKYRRISLDNDEEEKEDENDCPHQYRELPDILDERERRDSNLRTSRKISRGKQRQSNLQLPQRHSHGEQAARGSKHMRQVRRSHSEVSIERANSHGRDCRVNMVKPIAKKASGRGRPTKTSRRGPSPDPVRRLVPPSRKSQVEVERRSSSMERLPVQNSSSYVHAASAWTTNKTEVLAMTGAFQELMTKLGGDVHFVVVGFSTGFSAEVIVNLLWQLAPGVPYIGGTIARGMCDENAWVSVNRHNDEGLVTLWGVNDPHGIYSVVHAEYSQIDAHEKTYAATKTAFDRLAGDVDAGEKPAFIATYACPLFVELAIDGIREAIQCPIIGGCSSDATRHGEGEVSVSWIQISSSSSSDYTKSVRDGRGDWTEMGIAFALCFPSVETYVSWFSGYSPVGVNSEYCMGTVTKAVNKTIYEIDCKPAAEVYQEWLDVASDKSQTELSSIGFPRLGSLHPLGTTVDFVSNQMEIDRSIDVNSSSSLCSMQSSDWSKLINMTAVITGINEDGSLSTTSSVTCGTNVVLMETSAQSLKTAINKPLFLTPVIQMGAQAVESNKFYIHETIGCLMFLSAGVQALLGHKSMAEMVGAYKDWSGGASLMGMTTFGEIGHLPNSNDVPHYDSLMFDVASPSRHRRRRSRSESPSRGRSAHSSSRRHSRRKRSRSRSLSSRSSLSDASYSREHRRASKSSDKHRKKRSKTEKRERRRMSSHSRSRSRSRSSSKRSSSSKKKKKKKEKERSHRSSRKSSRRSRSRRRSETRVEISGHKRSEATGEQKKEKQEDRHSRAVDSEAPLEAVAADLTSIDSQDTKVGETKSFDLKKTRAVVAPVTATPDKMRNGGVIVPKFKFSGISLKSGYLTNRNQGTTERPATFCSVLNEDSNNVEKEEIEQKSETLHKEQLKQKKEEKAKFLEEEDAVPKLLNLWTPEYEEKDESVEECKTRKEEKEQQRERVQKVVEEVDPLDAYMAGLVDEAAMNQSRANPAANVISQTEIEAKGKINIYGTFLPPDAPEQSPVALPEPRTSSGC
ncbi:unnamed protein product [Peronospora effusa]|nr:unnamed protein product [Peronospora effusa]